MTAFRIAVVHPVELGADALHRDLVPIAYGLQELGYEVKLYAPTACVNTVGLELVLTPDGLTDPSFWRAEAPTWALVLTWLGCGEILEALKEAGACVIAKGDTDGLVSARRHPRSHWQRMVLHKRSRVSRARAVWHLAKRIGPLHASEMRVFTRALAAADALVVESRAAQVSFEETVAAYGTRPPPGKVLVQWNPVDPAFSRLPLTDARARLVVVVGRWDDPQKDARTLRRTLARVLVEDPDVCIEVFGPRGEIFDGLDPIRVSVRGAVANAELPSVFRRARVIAFASRWEGLPIAALEALACGCSVVGTRIPAFIEIEASGGGRAVARRDASLAGGILEELRLWDEDYREGSALGEAWRARVDRRCVAAAYADVFRGIARGRDAHVVRSL